MTSGEGGSCVTLMRGIMVPFSFLHAAPNAFWGGFSASQTTITVKDNMEPHTGAIWWAVRPKISASGRLSAAIVGTGQVHL